ncbi:glycosyltransferase family 2 protein [Paenibacillus sp. MMO-177]|uniref:glycosyltransferase family 2 protein n=1 Tax=Paenibacillus sp. MMO-177 TaxID=3081289 RepID=UPI0030187212
MSRLRRTRGLARKRQWGTERDPTPLSIFHDKPSTRKMVYSRLAIIFTIGFWITYVITTIIRQYFIGPNTFRFVMESLGYLVIVTLLTFSALMYLLARQGALQRFSKHVRVPRAEIDRYFDKNQPTITVLVPSYNEEPGVVRKTLLSAALQEYPHIRIVLLLDDAPYPTDPDTLARLNATRQLAKDIEQLLAEPRLLFESKLAEFLREEPSSSHASLAVTKELAEHYAWAADWLDQLGSKEEKGDHVGEFFAHDVVGGLSEELRLVHEALIASYNDKARLPVSRVSQLYQRLTWIFNTELEVFERKKFASLSHEPNKAMNLNSYIGLMGRTYNQVDTPDGPILVPASGIRSGENIVFPDSEFVLTLDADSILRTGYCLRLVYFLQQPDNARVAVVQTPYSSFRGAATRIERIAGATTDIQHILHQGMTYYNATFWVGANAVIRKSALEDIGETEWVGGFEIRRFIQDRTVIEDTESSVDLAKHNWTLFNYPERLSYSATPPDFGSLIVQRRRWANGGLIILPKLWSLVRDRKRHGNMMLKTEILLRLNYLTSIAWASFGLIFLLAYPIDGRLLSPFVLLAALPYFLAMASDLKYSRYKRSDVFRIYGFNLILLPVNLAGVLKSMQQALSAKKIPFARTPKVKERTVSPMLYVISPLIIIGISLFTLWQGKVQQNWGNAAFAAFNAITALWAVVEFIGIKNTVVDVWLSVLNWLYVPVKKKQIDQEKEHAHRAHWQSILYHGDAEMRLSESALDHLALTARAPHLEEKEVMTS